MNGFRSGYIFRTPASFRKEISSVDISLLYETTSFIIISHVNFLISYFTDSNKHLLSAARTIFFQY